MIELSVRARCSKLMPATVSPGLLKECSTWTIYGKPRVFEMDSFEQVLETFKKEIRNDFFVTIRATKYCILHRIDEGASSSEASTASQRKTKPLKALITTNWFYTHGCPRFFSANVEFTGGQMNKILDVRGAILKKQPVKQFKKTALVDCKTQKFWLRWKDLRVIILKLQIPRYIS